MHRKFKLSARQRQIVVGKLLGDGHVETANGRTFRLKFEHSLRQKDYVDWFYKELQNIAASAPRVKHQRIEGKIYDKYWFNTAYSSSFRFYRQQFYNHNKKVVPKLIHRWLTPLAFAVWFMDDGSVKSRESSGKYLNTQGFDRVSIHRLRNALRENFGITTTLRRQKEGTQIYIPSSEVGTLRAIIRPHVIPSMQYKLG